MLEFGDFFHKIFSFWEMYVYRQISHTQTTEMVQMIDDIRNNSKCPVCAVPVEENLLGA